jgi:hypothetical protein
LQITAFFLFASSATLRLGVKCSCLLFRSFEGCAQLLMSSETPSRLPATLAQGALLWALFFLICMGLGYPPLNRYDPGKLGGTSDVVDYRDMVMGRQSQPAASASGAYARLAQAENYYRVLVPYVAKPFYWLANGHVGTWNAALLALLVANAMFTATTAYLLAAVGLRLGFNLSTALLGATLYLLNFSVANFNLAGLIDSAEGCFVMVIVWSLLTERWYLLPLWGILGALAKETFAPLSVVFVCGWWMAEARRDSLQLSRLVWIGALGVASITAVIVAMSTVAGGLVWPWEFAAYKHVHVAFLRGLWGCLADHAFWYVFIWLLPLGLVRLRRMPTPWVLATAVAFCGALALGAYNNAGGNTTRALFNVAGPILSLSAAVFLVDPRKSSGADPNLPF